MEVEITDEEAATVGLWVGRHVNQWGELAKPLLMAKGVSESKLSIGYPCQYWRSDERAATVFRFPD